MFRAAFRSQEARSTCVTSVCGRGPGKKALPRLLLITQVGKSATAWQPVLQRVNRPDLSNSNCSRLQTPRAWLTPALACLAATAVSQCQLNLEGSVLSRHQRLCGFEASPKMTCSPIPTDLKSRAAGLPEMWCNFALLFVPNFLPFLIHSPHRSNKRDIFLNVNWIVLLLFSKPPNVFILNLQHIAFMMKSGLSRVA